MTPVLLALNAEVPDSPFRATDDIPRLSDDQKIDTYALDTGVSLLRVKPS